MSEHKGAVYCLGSVQACLGNSGMVKEGRREGSNPAGV